jgi:hypothetical protein
MIGKIREDVNKSNADVESSVIKVTAPAFLSSETVRYKEGEDKLRVRLSLI